MLARRLLLLIAVLMALSVVTIGINPAPPRQSVMPLDPPHPPRTGTPAATVEVTLDAGAAKARTVAVDAGDSVHLRVTADDLDSVQVLGLDMLAAVAPETPAEFDIRADAPGDYPVVLVDSGKTVGTLHVTAVEG